MKRLLPLMLFSFTGLCLADSLQVPLVSHHIGLDDVNEVNPGLFYEKDIIDHFSVVGGVFKNSYSKAAAVLGIELQYEYVGMQAGFATGYEALYGNTLQFTGGVFAEVPIMRDVRARVLYVPHKDGVLGFSLVFSH